LRLDLDVSPPQVLNRRVLNRRSAKSWGDQRQTEGGRR
jgi:hypothetical protein